MFYAPDIHRQIFAAQMSHSIPRIRIREGSSGRYLLQIECPGYMPEELELLIDRDILCLRGTKRFARDSEPGFMLPASFEYSIPFDFNLTDASIKSLFAEGILNILISRIPSRDLTGIRTIYIEPV